MLVLSRRDGESIEIPELGIVIQVTSIKKSRVTLGIEAPKELAILRGEVVESVSTDNNGIAPKPRSRRFAAASAVVPPKAPPIASTVKEPSSDYSLLGTNTTSLFQVA